MRCEDCRGDGKVLIDAGSTLAVESPTYLGALQAFALFVHHAFTQRPARTQ